MRLTLFDRLLYMRRFVPNAYIETTYLILLGKFGDGIMSMIDCKVNIERKPDPKGDRVVLTFECVF